MIKKTFTLSLVATMLAGLSMVATLEPAQANGCDGQRGFQSNRDNGFLSTTAANRYSLNNGNGRFNNGFGNSFNNQGFNNKSIRKQEKRQAKLARRQQMAAAGILPIRNTGLNNGFGSAYAGGVNPYANAAYSSPYANAAFGNGLGSGVCNQNNNVSGNGAYSAGYNKGYNDAASGVAGNGYGVNGLGGLNGINGINGLGLNGLNGYGSSLNQGGGISSILGRVLNGF